MTGREVDLILEQIHTSTKNLATKTQVEIIEYKLDNHLANHTRGAKVISKIWFLVFGAITGTSVPFLFKFFAL